MKTNNAEERCAVIKFWSSIACEVSSRAPADYEDDTGSAFCAGAGRRSCRGCGDACLQVLPGVRNSRVRVPAFPRLLLPKTYACSFRFCRLWLRLRRRSEKDSGLPVRVWLTGVLGHAVGSSAGADIPIRGSSCVVGFTPSTSARALVPPLPPYFCVVRE